MVYTKPIMLYSQVKVWTNSCSFLAILTNLSNLTWIKLRYEDIKSWYAQLRTEWAWAIVNTTTINKVLSWFNSFYKKNIKFNMLTASTSLRHTKIWKMVYIWFRWNRESAYDFQVDGVINRCPDGKMEWGHSCNLIRDWVNYVILDNYEWERTHNRYVVSEDILKQMIARQIIRWTAYIFSEGA